MLYKLASSATTTGEEDARAFLRKVMDNIGAYIVESVCIYLPLSRRASEADGHDWKSE